MTINHRWLVAVVLGCAVEICAVGPARAAHTVYVNPNTGTNTPPCSAAAPCLTITYALSQVDSGGEVVLVASGVYDAFAVTKSVTVRAARGLAASVVAPSGGSGITVNGSGIVVQLQGIDVSGATTGTVSTNCINFLAGTKLSLSLGMSASNCAVGINMQSTGSLVMKQVDVQGGTIAGGIGVQVANGSTHINLSTIDGSMPGGALVMTLNAAQLTIEASQLGSTASITGMAGLLGGSSAQTVVINSRISDSAWGVFTNVSTARVCMVSSLVYGNNLGLFPQAGNICNSTSAPSTVTGNVTNGSFTCSC